MTSTSGAVVDEEEEYEEVEEYEEEEEESDMRSADCSSGDWGERGDMKQQATNFQITVTTTYHHTITTSTKHPT